MIKNIATILGLSSIFPSTLNQSSSPTYDEVYSRQSSNTQIVNIPPSSFTVLPDGATFRQNFYTDLFNPTDNAVPFFQVFHPDFYKILGSDPIIRRVTRNPGDQWQIAHEAPIYMAETDEVFFASNAGGPDGHTGRFMNNHYFNIRMKEVEEKWAAEPGIDPINVTVTALPLPDSIQMTNGGTGPYNGNLLLANSGRDVLPPTLAMVNPKPPYNATILLNNFYGRQFNSFDDLKVHPTNGKIYLTDPDYGYLLRFRGLPLFPKQIYCFNPETGEIHIAASDFDQPNGIAFTADGKTVYIGDSGGFIGFIGRNSTDPSTIYAFDVDETTHGFKNRRTFAYVDAGVPDGIQLDTNGNVYTGCGDGVQVFNPAGVLLGKFFVGGVAPNLVFAGPGRLVILAETMVYVAKIAAKGLVS